MAEHDQDRDNDNGRPLDEDAAWASIVAGYGEEPPDPPGAKPFKSVEEMAGLTSDTNDVPPEPPAAQDSGPDSGPDGDRPLGSSVTFAPGVGPRDYALPETTEPAKKGGDDLDPDDEGHFVPPEPPPLPEADPTAKGAWLAVIGGPVLMLLAVLLGWEMTWWLTTLGVGGFIGGFATLVYRMNGDDDEHDDPGRGAVV
ncbi:hypothetical protein ACX6XY_13055 [Streptomyces sp. O3]